MKVLVFTDIHGNLNVLHMLRQKAVEENADLVLCAGDFTVMGQQQSAILSRLNLFRVPVFLIHGNHENEEELVRELPNYPNITFLHKKIIQRDGWWFGSYATSGMGEQYPDQEHWVAEHGQEIAAAAATGKLVWLDHPPPANTSCDELAEEWHVGSISLRKLIEKHQPAYVFCGHLHENFGKEDRIKNTRVVNPGPVGKILNV